MFRFKFAFAVFFFVVGAVAALTGAAEPLSTSERTQYKKYLEETLNGMELMRGENGLIADDAYVDQSKGTCTVKVVNDKTSPTNIALDIINQLDLLRDRRRAPKAEAVLNKITATMDSADFKRGPSGMFFGWYSIHDSTVFGTNLSSVDNANLALALWTAAETAPNSEFGRRARSLFDSMDFSLFVNERGLFATALKLVGIRWARTKANYSYLGSEARTIYAIAQGIGVLKSGRSDGFRLDPDKLQVEVYSGPGGPILKTWDGGTFQLLLPEMLMSENLLSPSLRTSFDNAATLGIAKATAATYPLPALFSAGNRGTGTDQPEYQAVYVGGSGTPELTASANKGPLHGDFDLVVTPHAVMMAATRNPHLYAEWFKKMENLSSSTYTRVVRRHFWSFPQYVATGTGFVNHLYCSGVGFTDGFFVKGPQTGEVVSSILALDQGMAAMALNHILSPDGFNSSARALAKNAAAHDALEKFYSKIKF